MELKVARIKLPTRMTRWRLHGLGDIHWGSAMCDERSLKAKINEIKNDEHAYWFGMGDYIEGIGHKDPRFDPTGFPKGQEIGTLDDIFMYQARRLFELLKPIKGKCLGMIVGNHEESVRLHNAQDPGRSIAELMGTHDLRYSALVRIEVMVPSLEKGRDPDKVAYHVNWFGHHGWGGGRMAGGQANKLAHHMNEIAPYNSDIVFMGHVHGSLWVGIKPWFKVTDKGKLALMPTHRAMALTGTYYKNWMTGVVTYAERAGFPPSRIGSPYVEIQSASVNCLTDRGREWEKEVPVFKVTA